MMLNNLSILLQNSVATSLDKNLYKTIEFKNFQEAFLKLEKNDIAAVVSDDIEIIRKIKQKYSNIISIIAIIDDKNSIREFIQSGATEFVLRDRVDLELNYRVELCLSKYLRFKYLTELINKDHLTNLFNKKYFFEKGKKIYNNSKDVAICIIDIDDFKKTNDTFGHLAGDLVIKDVANALKKNTKGKDLVARFGGDEFCVILQDISDTDTKKLFDKIEDSLKNKNISISTGIHTTKEYSLELALHIADMNLYKVKKKKRKKFYKSYKYY